jgi:hypothetical protein
MRCLESSNNRCRRAGETGHQGHQPAGAEIAVAAATERESNQALREGQIRLPGSYAIDACDSRLTQFPGMILVRRPSCVVIAVTNPATGKSSTASVPMYGANCT